jgi:hypothetical protein
MLVFSAVLRSGACVVGSCITLLSYMSISPAGFVVAYRQEEVDRAQRYDPEHLQMPWLQAMDSVGA